MAQNFLLLAILCSSSFLSWGVNGGEIQNEKANSTSLASRKTKRAIDLDAANFSNQNDLGLQSSADTSESNDLPAIDDTTGSFHPLSIAKRAPSGFTGMRGKKQQEYTDLSPNDLDWGFKDDFPYNDIRNKKAPLGFNGVRGKKMDYETNLLDQLLRRLYEERNEQQDSYRSHVPLYLRGYEDWENSLEKRAPVGFTGMRGKRPIDLPFDGGKRNPNAFFGVRGKRDFKRSAMEQFNSRYFDMRGKKQPNILGFRNKFVGVRGKKDTTAAALHDLEPQQLEIPISNYRSSARFLVEPAEFFTLKRTPNGFVGMRGKRQVNTVDLDNVL